MGYQATATQLHPNAPCPCGKWHYRRLHLSAQPGFSAAEDYCPECKTPHLLVYQSAGRPLPTSRFVAAIPLSGQNEISIRTALTKVPGIMQYEIDMMVMAALDLAYAAHN